MLGMKPQKKKRLNNEEENQLSSGEPYKSGLIS
jgi:hypothetical protein